MDFCSIASGSSGNCIFAGTDHTGILIDAGISGKRIAAGLHAIDRKPEELDGILITHEHIDHIKGLGVLARKYGIPVYSSAGTIRTMLEGEMLGKVDASLFHQVEADKSFCINDMEIHPFRVSHDAAEPFAYRMQHQDKTVAVATDLGYYDDYIVENLKGLDAVLIESNHDVNMLQVGTYPYYLKQRILGNKGHLSNETAGRLLCRLLHDRLQAAFLGHLSQENNYEALAYETVCSEVTMGENPWTSSDFKITVAHRDRISDLVTI
mgnify:CR=1 FL=1